MENNPLIFIDPSGHFKFKPYEYGELENILTQAMKQTSTKNAEYWAYRSYLGTKFQPIFNDKKQ